MSCTPLPKAAKPVWAKQLTRLPRLVVYVKFQRNLPLDYKEPFAIHFKVTCDLNSNLAPREKDR